MHNLTRAVLTRRVEAPAAAGQTTLTTDWCDTQGYDGIRFITALGTLTTGATTDTIVKAQMSDNSDGSSPSDVTGASLTIDEDADDNKLVIVDVYKPLKRYVAVVIDPGNQNVVHDLTIAELYGPTQQPVAAHADVARQAVVASAAAV